jgi:RNase P/RNase MRP subunit p30
MKKFYDLHLPVPLSDFGLAEKMIRKAAALGYAGVGIPFPFNVPSETVSKLRQLCTDVGIDLITRVNLAPKSSNELLFQLRRHRRRFEIISVACWHKPVARQAAKDRRVDLITFPSLDFKERFFDSAEAELAANALALLEIDMFRLLSATSFERIRLLSYLRREVAIARKFSVPVVTSSNATDEFFIRRPRDFAAFAYLFDMQLDAALETLSDNPLAIVTRNRMKLQPNYVAPGLRVVRRGKDCGES